MSKYAIFHKVWNPPSQLYWYYSQLLGADSKSEIMELVKPYLKNAGGTPNSNRKPHTVICLLELQNDGLDIILKKWFICDFELHEGEVVGRDIH